MLRPVGSRNCSNRSNLTTWCRLKWRENHTSCPKLKEFEKRSEIVSDFYQNRVRNLEQRKRGEPSQGATYWSGSLKDFRMKKKKKKSTFTLFSRFSTNGYTQPCASTAQTLPSHTPLYPSRQWCHWRAPTIWLPTAAKEENEEEDDD